MKDTYSKPKYIKTIYGVGYKIEKVIEKIYLRRDSGH